MKFNIDDYKGKYVMHCKTEEEAKDFCKYLHEHGREWCTGNSYLKDTNWERYKADMVYEFNSGAYSNITLYKNHNYTILEWEDFMNSTFTKADLRTGDIIKQRNGEIGVVNRNLEMITCKRGGWLDLDKFNSDLTHHFGKDYEIVLVRRPKAKADCNFDAINNEWGTLVYDRERDGVEEMTLAEVCKLLGKNIKIIK
jgi:hypothetical protein